MPTSPFTITVGSNTVVLNAERKGAASFTVTNISGRPVRGRAVLVPLGQTVPGWLAIAGEAEREFGIASAQQYTVQVAVPMDAAPGGYTFRLDEVGVDNPDENFTQGPGVAFQVVPPPPPPPPSRPFPWWIVAVVAGVIVVVGVVIFLLTRPGNFGGTWQTNIADIVLTQNGSTISGTIQIYGTTALIPVTGTVSRGTLTGLILSGIPYTLTLASGGGSFDGSLSSGSQIPWCGVRSGALPAGCGFSGRWNLAGDGMGAGASAEVVQTGPSVSGSFSNGTANGQVAGIVSGLQVEGQFNKPGGGSGPFKWLLVLVDGKDDQFRGNGDGLAWCGFRDGSTAPSPCLATLLQSPSPALIP